jgi:hypothetical protein
MHQKLQSMILGVMADLLNGRHLAHHHVTTSHPFQELEVSDQHLIFTILIWQRRANVNEGWLAII